MAGVITTGNHPAALWPGIRAFWGRTYDEHEEEYSKIFDMESSDKNYEEDVLVTGFGLAPAKSEGTSTSYDSETQGFTKRYTHVAYSLGYIVTREELDDNLYETVSKRRAQALAYSMRQTKENVAANVINRGFTSTYAGGDGKELFATDHPTKSGNQSNELTVAADISAAAIEDLLIQIAGSTNYRGLKISQNAKCLVVPRQLWFDANRIITSTLQSGTANNDSNILNATSAFPDGIVMNHYLTDSDAWFIKASIPGAGMTGFDRVAVDFTQDSDFDTDNAKAKCYERYSFGWTDWRAMYGSPGA
jgi:hypothetical protein